MCVHFTNLAHRSHNHENTYNFDFKTNIKEKEAHTYIRPRDIDDIIGASRQIKFARSFPSDLLFFNFITYYGLQHTLVDGIFSLHLQILVRDPDRRMLVLIPPPDVQPEVVGFAFEPTSPCPGILFWLEFADLSRRLDSLSLIPLAHCWDGSVGLFTRTSGTFDVGSGPEALSVAADDLCQSRLLIPTDRRSGLQCASLTSSLAKFVDIALAFSKSCSSSLWYSRSKKCQNWDLTVEQMFFWSLPRVASAPYRWGCACQKEGDTFL
jgi:hypothetical protein